MTAGRCTQALTAALLLLALLALPVHSAPVPVDRERLGKIKQAMAKRLAAIEERKEKGLVGENAEGYLEAVRDQTLDPETAKLVDEENTDRAAVYATIAAQLGTTTKLVGIRRAKQLFDHAEPGEWLKAMDGTWHRK